MNQTDELHLHRAIELARRARDLGEAPFGSMLVGHDGTVLMEAHNTVRSQHDISAHPEFKIAMWAARELAPASAAGTTMYTSCQPCQMCSGAIDRSGIGQVVYALSESQLRELRGHAGIARVPQLGPHLHELAAEPLRGYFQR